MILRVVVFCLLGGGLMILHVVLFFIGCRGKLRSWAVCSDELYYALFAISLLKSHVFDVPISLSEIYVPQQETMY